MTTYLYWHALSAALAMWLLIRTVSCSNVVGIVAMLFCAIFGPFALFALVCGAFMSLNAMQDEHESSEMRDQEFYKHKHNRRHK